MKTERHHEMMSDRYRYDFGRCSWKNGFAQVDTREDAAYYGTWASVRELTIINYCEGDVTIQTADNVEEFAAAIRELKEWCDGPGPKFLGIDPGLGPGVRREFTEAGLADLLY